MKNKDLIEKFKLLKSIKADESFKASLRAKILNEIGGDFNLAAKPQPTFLGYAQSIFSRKAMAITLIIAMVVLGSGIGGAYASQSALPGDALYPVKLLTEDVRMALKFNPESKANLEMSFAAKRLEEIKNVLEEKGVDAKGLDIAQERLERNLLRATEVIESEKSKNENMSDVAKDKLEQIKKKKEELKEKIEEKRKEKGRGFNKLNGEKEKTKPIENNKGREYLSE